MFFVPPGNYQICTSRSFSHSSIHYLAVLIEQHHNEFLVCYLLLQRCTSPKTCSSKVFNFLAKFLLHLSVSTGPLVSMWCMRMEAKHSYFKHVAQISNCFKNVPYLVAKRHQRLLCCHLQGNCFCIII